MFLLPWEPPNIWRAFTNRWCKSGDQHLLAFRWVCVVVVDIVCPSVVLAAPFPCSTVAPAPPLLQLSLLGHGTRFSGSKHFFSCISVSSEASASSGSAWIGGLVQMFLSLENGWKAPPFLCLLSKVSFGLTPKLVSVSFTVVVAAGWCLVPSFVWLHSWAVVIQLDFSDMFDALSCPSELGCLRGMNSSRTGFDPWLVWHVSSCSLDASMARKE